MVVVSRHEVVEVGGKSTSRGSDELSASRVIETTVNCARRYTDNMHIFTEHR